MRVFVTGGTGFVGKVLVPLLVERGHEVMVLIRSNFPESWSKQDGIRYLIGDLKNVSALCSTVKDFKADNLIHLAWEGIPDYSQQTCMRNFKQSVDLFTMAEQVGCSNVISTGSCWEYAGRNGKFSEKDELGAAGIFPAVKNSLRFMGEAIAQQNGIQFCWLRLFFVYGPGQRSKSLIPSIIESVSNDRCPDIQSPHNKNDFVFVDDVAKAIVEVLEQRPNHTVFNVGTGCSTSVETVVRMTYEAMGKSFDPDIFTGEQTETKQDFLADISRIEKDTGWRPEYNIEAGIKKIVNHF